MREPVSRKNEPIMTQKNSIDIGTACLFLFAVTVIFCKESVDDDCEKHTASTYCDYPEYPHRDATSRF